MSMSRVFYEPFYALSDLDRLFDEAFNARAQPPSSEVTRRIESATPRMMRPKMDLFEDEKADRVVATFELPGLRKEDVSIDVQNNLLTIAGECKKSSDREEQGYHVRERRFGKFARSLAMPQGVKDNDIKAHMENGILTVTFPRTTAEQAAKKVMITGN